MNDFVSNLRPINRTYDRRIISLKEYDFRTSADRAFILLCMHRNTEVLGLYILIEYFPATFANILVRFGMKNHR